LVAANSSIIPGAPSSRRVSQCRCAVSRRQS
jgi:hypothetical protein